MNQIVKDIKKENFSLFKIEEQQENPKNANKYIQRKTKRSTSKNSTKEMSKSSSQKEIKIQNKIEESEKADKLNKKEINEIDFTKMENLLEYMKTGCEQFHQKFEIAEYLKKGGSGYIYLGRLKSNPNKNVILKFLFRNVGKDNK